MPSVSVLMTVYNGMPYLPLAVDSILAQTFDDFELVIVDDGSTDESPELLSQITDRRVRTLRQENGGPAAASNAGLQLCTGEFVARMDADDVSLPHRLSRQVAFMRSHPQVGLLGSQFVYLGKSRVGRRSSLPLDHPTIWSHLKQGKHAVCNGTTLCRRDRMEEIGGYWKTGIAEDWDMFLRMGAVAELRNLDEPLYQVRVHPASLNARRMVEMRARISYACECSERREQGLPLRDFATFLAERQRGPLWRRTADRLDGYAMLQYRRALSEMLSDSWLRGSVRLGWAGMCGPHLAAQRLSRVLRKRLFARAAAPAADRLIRTNSIHGSKRP